MSRIKLILFNFGLLTLAALFMSYNANPPDGKTGAPGEGTCGDCHSGGTSTADVEILGLPASINANEAYNITVRVTKTGGSAVKAGFQLVALNSSNQNVGDLTALSSDHGTSFLGSKEYVDHRNGKAFSANVAEWTFKWQAPSGPNGTNITLYGIANLCNGNNNTGGDNYITTNASGQLMINATPLELSMTSTNVTCNGAANGQATAIPSGGTPPYTYAWTNGKNTQTITNLSPGNYTVTVTDNAGQKKSDQVSITQPSALALSVNTGTLTCAKTDLVLKATVSGGTPGYAYLWSTFETSQEISVDEPGVYTVVITDDNGCTKSASVTVGQNVEEPVVLIDPPVLISCSNPVVQLNATITLSNAILSWTTIDGNIVSGKSTNKPQVNNPGTYTLTATNPANGCVTVESVTVDGVLPVSAQAAITNVLCHGDSTGAITVTASGGLAPYSYIWSNGEKSSTVDSLPAGNYTVIVSDNSTCHDTLVLEVKQAPKLVPVMSSTDLTGPNSNDGTASVSPQGGTPGYSILWSNGSTADTITNLAVGSYSVTITDSLGCNASQSVIINPFNCGLVADAVVTNVTCYGGNDGGICLQVSGGSAPYSYLWSQNETSPCLNNLAVGTYGVTVTDTDGCVAIKQLNIVSPAAIILPSSAIVITTESSFGANDASVVVNPSGGVPPYQVFYDNGASDGTMLQAGNHTVEVKDSLGCSVIFPFFVPAYPCDSLGIKAIDLDVQTSCFDKPVTLSIKNISGGQPAYNILWSNGSTDSTVTDTFKNLTSLKVTDAKNCLFTLILDIDQPDSIFVNFEINDATPGNTDGSVLVSATGGQGTFSYLWQDGSTTELLTGLAPGNYCVTITDAAGCSVVKCAEVKLKVSTNDLISQGWKLFPNPAKDFLYLKQAIVDGSQVSWQILDASGTNILTGEQKNTAGTIPVSVAHLPSGQYYLLLHHHSKQLYAKFIIK